MTLKNLFDMVKADRYTADGREALIKAQEAETEDKVYQIGEISQKTGLQKTANGWVKPKNGKQPGVKKETPEEFIKNAKEKQQSKTEARLKEEQARPQKAIESARQNFEEYKKENPDWQNKSEEEIYRELGKKAREAESKPAASRREAVSAGRMMKDLDGNFWSRPEDFKEDITSRGWDVDEMTNEYAVISNEAGSQYEVRFDDHSDDGDLTVRTFKALQIDEDDEDDSLEEDAAPKIRQLTGDTRIRVRKA